MPECCLGQINVQRITLSYPWLFGWYVNYVNYVEIGWRVCIQQIIECGHYVALTDTDANSAVVGKRTSGTG